MDKQKFPLSICAAVIALVLLLSVSFTACDPTPEVPTTEPTTSNGGETTESTGGQESEDPTAPSADPTPSQPTESGIQGTDPTGEPMTQPTTILTTRWMRMLMIRAEISAFVVKEKGKKVLSNSIMLNLPCIVRENIP